MREILFRGKTLTGRWVEGSYYKEEEFYGNKEDADVIITSKEHLSYDQALEYAIVIPETVGQYTGLTDNNGKKIFEGDILNGLLPIHPDWRIFRVGYENNGFYFFNDDKDGDKLGWHPDHIVDYEVIGNIHDNPELSKGGAE